MFVGIVNSPGQPYPLLQELNTETKSNRANTAPIVFKIDFLICKCFIFVRFYAYKMHLNTNTPI